MVAGSCEVAGVGEEPTGQAEIGLLRFHGERVTTVPGFEKPVCASASDARDERLQSGFRVSWRVFAPEFVGQCTDRQGAPACECERDDQALAEGSGRFRQVTGAALDKYGTEDGHADRRVAGRRHLPSLPTGTVAAGAAIAASCVAKTGWIVPMPSITG